jgi:DNA transformation protein
MSADSEFIDYLLELLEPVGPVEAKAMFGGFGIYLHGLMFGLVSEDVFYLKGDDNNRPDFENRQLEPFTYKRKGKEYSMSYYRAPDEAMDDSAELSKWAQNAYEAAIRGARNKARRKA